MNAGDILDAIGLLDDSLIQEAEEYSRPRKQAGFLGRPALRWSSPWAMGRSA